MNSIANALTPCAASVAAVSFSVYGARKCCQNRALLHRGDLVRVRSAHFQDDVGILERRRRIGRDHRAGGGIVRVAELRAVARAGFDKDIKAEPLELLDRPPSRGDRAFRRRGALSGTARFMGAPRAKGGLVVGAEQHQQEHCNADEDNRKLGELHEPRPGLFVLGDIHMPRFVVVIGRH